MFKLLRKAVHKRRAYFSLAGKNLLLLQGKIIPLQLKAAKEFICLRGIPAPRCLQTREYIFASVTYSTGLEGDLCYYKD